MASNCAQRNSFNFFPIIYPAVILSLLTFCMLGSFACFLSGKPLVSNRLDPDQAQQFVGPDLGRNYLELLQGFCINSMLNIKAKFWAG